MMSQLEQVEAIEKRLWTAADTLRANSDYASNGYFFERRLERIHESEVDLALLRLIGQCPLRHPYYASRRR